MNRPSKPLATPPPSLHSLAELTSDLRRSVSARLMRDFGVRVPPALIRRVVDEAAEVAQASGFPNLFFPVLAEEKARSITAALETFPLTRTLRPLPHAA